MRFRRLNTLLISMIFAEHLALGAQAPPTTQSGPQEQLKDLEMRAAQLYKQGQYAEALPVAKEAERLAETNYGPEDERTAEWLRFIGGLYEAQTKWTDAEQIYGRALAIFEKTLGPDDLRVG